MEQPRKIAIACQGGGIHGAFTCGVLEQILQEAEALQKAETGAKHFDIIGLSGTSAGALNAFMVWYGLLDAKQNHFAEARKALNKLWDTFQVQKSGELSMNNFAQFFFKLQGVGLDFKSPAPPLFYDWLMSTLHGWSALENSFLPWLDLGEIRPEFYDFAQLLKTCAPNFARIQGLGKKPQLLIGAVEILSGKFEVFDSHDQRKGPDARPISYEAVEASGTLPEVRRAQKIPGLKNSYGQDPLYWDGLFSQNPPVREFIAGKEDIEGVPDEIWVIRINPQKREQEPKLLGEIEDRRNELSGNLSLNQELDFIQKVNDWIGRYPNDEFVKGKKPIDIFMITMSPDKAELDVASKFNRDPVFVKGLREHGAVRGREFLKLWARSQARTWPQDAIL
ncbi:MAG: patatin-like phospholipase family protein [Candidatus Competibacteraceae bacterium]